MDPLDGIDPDPFSMVHFFTGASLLFSIKFTHPFGELNPSIPIFQLENISMQRLIEVRNVMVYVPLDSTIDISLEIRSKRERE